MTGRNLTNIDYHLSTNGRPNGPYCKPSKSCGAWTKWSGNCLRRAARHVSGLAPMANIFLVNQKEAILTLAACWAIRGIGRHRQTVQRYVEEVKQDSKCTTIRPPGSGSTCTISTAGKSERKSVCAPLVPMIESKAQQGLSAQLIYQDLKEA